MKIILTGASGLVGEGVLLECLNNSRVTEILMVNRRHVDVVHPKLKEIIIPDFMLLNAFDTELSGYDACFFCAGISSKGMSEVDYTQITFDITINFAKKLLALNPSITFNYISGASTDSSEKGMMMWARVKGKTENTLQRMGFKAQYNFRPGFMKPMPGQRNIKSYYKTITKMYPILIRLFPNHGCEVRHVALSMIHVTESGYSSPVLEVKDIKKTATE